MSDAITPSELSVPKYKKMRLLGLTVLALMLAAAAIFYWQYNLNRSVTTDNARVTGDTVDISPKISGRLERLRVIEGDRVKAGQLIANLDNAQYKLALDQADANLAQAKSNQLKLPMDQESAQAAFDKAQQAVSAASAQLKNSQISLADAQRILKINQSLSAGGALSQESLDKTQSDYDKAQTNVTINQANLLSAEAAAADAEAKRAVVAKIAGVSYQAQIKLAQAAYDLARLNYQNSFIKAPLSGTVVRVTEKVGENISAGQTILTICDLDSTWITASIDEKNIGRIKSGQKVEIKIDGYPGIVFNGRVDRIAGTTKSVFSVISTENTSGNYTKVSQYLPVKITVNHDGQLLRSGMSATIKIQVK